MRAPDPGPGARRPPWPWGTASRLLAGGVGGYALAQCLPVALVAPWGLARTDAVLLAMQLSFVVYAASFMAAFAARSPARAWAGVALAALAAAGVAWMTL